jgi:hypothetical protein
MLPTDSAWKPKKRKNKVPKTKDKPFGVELVMAKESAVGAPEAKYALDRIAGGSSVVKEAERLGVLESSFIAYFRQDEERYEAYLDALACQAELDHQKYRDASLKLIEQAEELTPEVASTIDKGLNRFKDTLGWNNARFRKEKDQSQVNVQVNIAEHLATLSDNTRHDRPLVIEQNNLRNCSGGASTRTHRDS